MKFMYEMQTIYYIVNMVRRFYSCQSKEVSNIPENAREPTEKEMRSGVPEWFRVQEVADGDVYYFSMNGQKFRSICEVKRWRENLQYEMSFESDEAPCF